MSIRYLLLRNYTLFLSKIILHNKELANIIKTKTLLK